jgi:hypothetical protein
MKLCGILDSNNIELVGKRVCQVGEERSNSSRTCIIYKLHWQLLSAHYSSNYCTVLKAYDYDQVFTDHTQSKSAQSLVERARERGGTSMLKSGVARSTSKAEV